MAMPASGQWDLILRRDGRPGVCLLLSSQSCHGRKGVAKVFISWKVSVRNSF